MTHRYLALAPEVDHFRQQFEAIAAEADALVAALTDEQFNWRPAPQAWSIAQCVDHLNVTARVYLPSLDDGIGDAMRRGLYGQGPFRYGALSRLFVRLTAPPRRVRMRAPKAMQPPPPRPRQAVMNAFRAYQVQYVDRLRQASGLDLSRARVASPVARWLRLPLGAGFELMIAHERRHLWQIRRIMSDAAFPQA